MSDAVVQLRRWLQLGHAGEGVEICGRLSVMCSGTGFNWATPVKAWRFGFGLNSVGPFLASIGPRR